MDFSNLARKELQALCKLNKIPANMTNIAMVDALKSLEIVKGVEEFLENSTSEIAQSSIESPQRNEVTSPNAPRTGCRTSTRRNSVKEEGESLQATIRSTRRVTRRAIAGEMTEEIKINLPETPAVRSSRKRVPAASESQKMEIQLKENEDQGKVDVPQTPAVVPSTKRRGAGVSTRKTNLRSEKEEDSTVQRVYSTRRSMRLTEKKPKDSRTKEQEISEVIKLDSYSEEISENDLGEVLENTKLHGFDSKEILQEVKESDIPPENIILRKDHEAVTKSLGSDVEVELYGDSKSIDNSETKSEVGLCGRSASEASSETKVIKNKGSNGFEIGSLLCNAENASELLKSDITENSNAVRVATDMKDELQEIKAEVFLLDTENPDEHLKLETREEYNSVNDVAALLSPDCAFRDEEDVDSLQITTPQETIYSLPEENVETNLLEFTASAAQDQNQDTAGPILDGKHSDVSFVKDQQGTLTIQDTEQGYASQEEVNCHDTAAQDTANFMIDGEHSDVNLVKDPQGMSCNTESCIIQGPENVLASQVEVSCDGTACNTETKSEPSEREDLELGLATGKDNFGDAEADLGFSFKQLEIEKEPAISELPNSNDSKENADQPEIFCGAISSEDELDSEKTFIKESGLPVAAYVTEPSHELPLLLEKSQASAGQITCPTSLTPVKKPSTKTPTTIKRLIHVSDDKENIDNSGRKLELTKVKENKSKKGPLDDKSLRQLTKMLKDKLKISNNIAKEDDKEEMGEEEIVKVTKTRPALQTLKENCLAAGSRGI